MKKDWKKFKHCAQIGLGVLAGAVAAKAVKSDTAKKIGVSTVAQGIKIKDSVDESIECARENISDVVAEAKVKNAAEALKKRQKLAAKEREEAEQAEETEEAAEKAQAE